MDKKEKDALWEQEMVVLEEKYLPFFQTQKSLFNEPHSRLYEFYMKGDNTPMRLDFPNNRPLPIGIRNELISIFHQIYGHQNENQNL